MYRRCLTRTGRPVSTTHYTCKIAGHEISPSNIAILRRNRNGILHGTTAGSGTLLVEFINATHQNIIMPSSVLIVRLAANITPLRRWTNTSSDAIGITDSRNIQT